MATLAADITRGGIRVQRDVRGNLVITTRGNGQAHVQQADVDDLRAVLAELKLTEQQPSGG